MRRQTRAAVRRWVAAGPVSKKVITARTLCGSRTAKKQTAAEQRLKEAIAQENAACQTRLLLIDRLHAYWAPVIHDYLAVLGKSMWGAGRYEIVDEADPDACWMEYQVKGLEWHERTDRYQVRNQDDWCAYEYRLGYRLRLELQVDHYVLGNTPLSEHSLKQWFLSILEKGCPQYVDEHLVHIY